MTENKMRRSWRQIAVTAIATGAMAVGALTLTATADAKPAFDRPGYRECVQTQFALSTDPIKRAEAMHVCCAFYNGVISGGVCAAPALSQEATPPRKPVGPGQVSTPGVSLPPTPPKPGAPIQTAPPAHRG